MLTFCSTCNAAPCICGRDVIVEHALTGTSLNAIDAAKSRSRWQGPCATCGRAPCRCLYMTPGQKMPDVTLTEADVDRIAFRVLELFDLRGGR